MLRNCAHCREPICDPESGKPIEFETADGAHLCDSCSLAEEMRSSSKEVHWDINLDCPAGSQKKQ